MNSNSHIVKTSAKTFNKFISSIEAEDVLSENHQILKILSLPDEYFGAGFGIYVCGRGFDRINLIVDTFSFSGDGVFKLSLSSM